MSSVLRRVMRVACSVSHKLFSVIGLAADRFYLLADVLPSAVVAVLVRYGLLGIGIEPFFDGETTTAFAQAALFVIAIVLSSVLQAYGEAECLPGNIACEIDALSSKIVLASSTMGDDKSWPEDVSVKSLHSELVAVLEGIISYLGQLTDDIELSTIIDGASQHIAVAVHSLDSAIEAESILGHFDELRSHLTRLSVIQRVDYIDAGYTLMDVLVYSSLLMSVLCEYTSVFAAVATIFLSTLMMLYIQRLVHDIDEPFSYVAEQLYPTLERVHADDDGEEEENAQALPSPHALQVEVHGRGRAEIDLFPLCNAYARAAQKAGISMGLPSADADANSSSSSSSSSESSSKDGSGLPHSKRFPPPSVVLARIGSSERRLARGEFVRKLKQEMLDKWTRAEESKSVTASSVSSAAASSVSKAH